MSLNYFARSNLVPKVISQLSALNLNGSFNFATTLYDDWKFEQAGAVDDLIDRGFDPATLTAYLPGNNCIVRMNE
jgi:hypothetical protein